MERLADKIVNEDLSVRAAEAVAGAGVALEGRAPKPRPGKRQGQLDEIAERLGDRLDTRVKVALGANKGTLTIEFANVQRPEPDPRDPGRARLPLIATRAPGRAGVSRRRASAASASFE